LGGWVGTWPRDLAKFGGRKGRREGKNWERFLKGKGLMAKFNRKV